jgi:hypothetical protein
MTGSMATRRAVLVEDGSALLDLIAEVLEGADSDVMKTRRASVPAGCSTPDARSSCWLQRPGAAPVSGSDLVVEPYN